MSDTMTRVFVADPDGDLLGRLFPALSGAGLTLVGSAASADTALPAIAAQNAEIVVVDAAACAATPAESIKQIVAADPELCVLVTAATATPPSILGHAVAAGARGFLLKPYRPEDLMGLIREVTGAARARRVRTSDKHRGRIVSVYAPKGGAGATTVAANLAVALAQTTKLRIGLVDLSLQFGDVGVLLNLKGANSIVELLTQASINDELVNDTFITHDSGVRVLLAPDDLSAVESIATGDVTHALDQLRSHFDIVICDLWAMYEQLTRDVLRMSDQLVLVTTPELPALRGLRRVLHDLRDDPRLAERSIVVVNRAGGKAGFSMAEVGKVLDREPSFGIPSDGRAITDAISRGLPLLDPRVHTRATKAFRDLAAYIATPPARPVAADQVGVAKGAA